jgi:hypothetical protein
MKPNSNFGKLKGVFFTALSSATEADSEGRIALAHAKEKIAECAKATMAMRAEAIAQRNVVLLQEVHTLMQELRTVKAAVAHAAESPLVRA